MSVVQWLVCVSLASLTSCAVSSTTVFTHGEGGWPCIRIPSVTRCGGNLHAFVECRNRTGDGCVPTTKFPAGEKPEIAAGICYKSSSDDGVTWSGIKQVVPGASQPTVVCNTDDHLIILQYNVGIGSRAVLSRDDGVTWSSPYSVYLGKNWAYVGPGRGLVLRSEKSPAPGRILFIGHHDAYEYDLVWYSDDGGVTYAVSVAVLAKMDEAQLVELSDGRVMANMRNNHLSSCDCRAVAISTDGGKTFGNITYDSTLISPVCMASIISMVNGSLVFANPASKTERVNGMLRRSDDGGRSWVRGWQVTSEDFAYSCLTHVAREDQVGLLWETAAQDCSGPSCQIVFSKTTVL